MKICLEWRCLSSSVSVMIRKKQNAVQVFQKCFHQGLSSTTTRCAPGTKSVSSINDLLSATEWLKHVVQIWNQRLHLSRSIICSFFSCCYCCFPLERCQSKSSSCWKWNHNLSPTVSTNSLVHFQRIPQRSSRRPSSLPRKMKLYCDCTVFICTLLFWREYPFIRDKEMQIRLVK